MQTLRGEDAPTLLSLLDSCRTGMGSRALRRWLLSPRRDRGTARRRHDAIAALHAGGDARRRCATRSAAPATSSASPRASACARCARASWPACAPRSARCRRSPRCCRPRAACCSTRSPPRSRRRRRRGELLARAIADEPAALLREGGVIAAGFDAELDELRAIGAGCDAFLLDMEARERERTGIAGLRVQYNRLHGFFIEVGQGAGRRRCRPTTGAGRR